MNLAEELENLIGDINSKPIDVPEQEKRFNKICNKIFIAGNDEIVMQLNDITGGPEIVSDIGKVLFLLRKELNKNTGLKFNDYKRKNLTKDPIRGR